MRHSFCGRTLGAAGQSGTVSIAELAKLKSLDLIHQDGLGIALTGNGRAIAEFC